MHDHIKLRALALGLALSAWAQMAEAAPITINTAAPISEDELILREQIILMQADDGVTDRRQINAVSVAGFGVSSKFSVFAMLPVVNIKSKTDVLTSERTGLGDAMIFGRYQIYAKDDIGKTTRIAPFAGLRLPSGARDITDHSTDVFGGLIFTQATLDYNLGAQISYDHNRQARGFDRGDRAEAAASFQYRLHPGDITGKSQGFIYGVLESKLAVTGDHRRDDIVISDSGGVQLSVIPGLQYSTKRWIADVALTVPLVDSREGPGPKMDYAVSAGWRVNF